jgi:hypothetical protein
MAGSSALTVSTQIVPSTDRADALVVFAAGLADLPVLQAAVLHDVAQRTLTADQGARDRITSWLYTSLRMNLSISP